MEKTVFHNHDITNNKRETEFWRHPRSDMQKIIIFDRLHYYCTLNYLPLLYAIILILYSQNFHSVDPSYCLQLLLLRCCCCLYFVQLLKVMGESDRKCVLEFKKIWNHLSIYIDILNHSIAPSHPPLRPHTQDPSVIPAA